MASCGSNILSIMAPRRTTRCLSARGEHWPSLKRRAQASISARERRKGGPTPISLGCRSYSSQKVKKSGSVTRNRTPTLAGPRPFLAQTILSAGGLREVSAATHSISQSKSGLRAAVADSLIRMHRHALSGNRQRSAQDTRRSGDGDREDPYGGGFNEASVRGQLGDTRIVRRRSKYAGYPGRRRLL